MNIVVLDGYTTAQGDLNFKWLNRYGHPTVYDRTPRENILSRSKGAEILFTNKTPLDWETLCSLPCLKYVGLLSTGYNIIDTKAAKDFGIVVTNIPDYSTQTVAQLVFAYILEFCSRVSLHDQAVHGGEWTASPDFCFCKAPLTELHGKTLGIIGFGRIGKTVARIAHAFGMQTLTFTPHPHCSETFASFRFADMGTLLSQSDFITLHCPLTDKTADLVNRDFLEKMKTSAYLINTSRGSVVNEADLSDALNHGIIAGAATDVLSTEPPQESNPLLTAKNCIITPHIAWAAKETRARLMHIAEENLSGFLAGNPVNTVF